jgi:hypothetical protein
VKRFFRHDAESDLGVGTAYLEVTEEWPTRQVEVYGDNWRWGDVTHNQWLADQPFEELGLSDRDSISQEEFERVWLEAMRRCPPGS